MYMKTINHELGAHMYTVHCMYSIYISAYMYMYMHIVYVNGVCCDVCACAWLHIRISISCIYVHVHEQCTVYSSRSTTGAYVA